MLIKIPHYIRTNDNLYSLHIEYHYDTSKSKYLWYINYSNPSETIYSIKNQDINRAQYNALDWIKKERLEYE